MCVYFRGVAAVSILFVFVGCKNSISDNSLQLALSADIRGFDPALAVDVRSGKLISLVYDNLVHFGDSTEILPGIAKSWSVSKDGLKYRFTIKDSVFFHDGSSLKAQDVVYSISRILSPEVLSPQSWMFLKVDGADAFMNKKSLFVKGLTAKNDSTLIIKLKAPFTPFIQYLAMPAASIINHKMETSINELPAGSGPWKLSSWKRDGGINLIRNENYWGEKPLEDTLSFRILSESITQSAEFEAGNLDFLSIPPTEIYRWKLKDKHKNRIEYSDELNIWYIGLNCSRPPFDDIRIRQAMSLSLDREKHLHLLIPGGELSSSAVPPSLLEGNHKINPYPYDPESAIKLLEEAGFSGGLDTELWVGGGSEMFHVLEAFQADWASVGINVRIFHSDWNVFKASVRNGRPPMYYLNWTADYPDAENFLYPLFFSEQSMKKRNRYSNPHLDEIILKIQSSSHGQIRNKLIQEACLILHNDAPWIFLWHKGSYTLTQNYIFGYRPKLVFNAERYIYWEKRPVG